MHLKFTRVIAVVISFCFFANAANAKVWRVNNTPGIAADFNSLGNAILSSSVIPGDTIHLEPSATIYSSVGLNKRLVIIGPGYFLGSGGNAGLQVSTFTSEANQIICYFASSGSKFLGLTANIYIAPDTDDLSIIGCTGIITTANESTIPNPSVKNLVINKCYMDIRLNDLLVENPRITNNIISSNCTISNVVNGLVRNNTFRNASPVIYNSYISNNIFSSAGLVTFVNCTVKYNVANTNLLPTDPNLHNVNNIPASTLFVGTGSADASFVLKPGAGNAAIGGGETIGGITPDCGAFGTADPYRLSGIPPIPSIYTLTVPASVPASSTTMDITISTRANN